MDGSTQLALTLTGESPAETPLEDSVSVPRPRRVTGVALSESVELCHRCERVTKWIAVRGVERCEGCGDRFPCAGRCSHLDCEEYRAARSSRGE
jgi:hypothetical protein